MAGTARRWTLPSLASVPHPAARSSARLKGTWAHSPGRIPVNGSRRSCSLRPDLVGLENAGSDLAHELREADAQRGARHIERFVASIVAAVRAAAQVDSGLRRRSDG